MQLAEERLQDHLVEGESVRTTASGRLLETGGRGRAVVGLTDRRLLCCSSEGEFVDVRYDYVCSVRSRLRTRMEWSGDERGHLAYLGGGLAATIAVAAALVALTSADPTQGIASVLLAAATVAVTAAVDRGRERPDLGQTLQVLLGAGAVAVPVLVGLGLFAANASAPVFLVATGGGLALAWYAARHREDLRELEFDRHRETRVSVNTIDGESVRVAVDGESDLGRELSACVYRESTPLEGPGSTPNPATDRARTRSRDRNRTRTGTDPGSPAGLE